MINRDSNAVAVWLTVCLCLVVAMVFVGGYTRLSGSGLSITEWKPIHGVVPPLNEAEWQEEFDAYKQSPQYQKVNMGMTLPEFKTIFWPEFFHRLLGRLIGFVFLFPWLVFVMRRSFDTKFAIRMAGIFLLGGLQGAVGWLMVKSGLVDAPYVSPLRLALHLSIAFIIFALILWALLDVLHAPVQKIKNSITNWYKVWVGLLGIQIIFGALVAGYKAGLIYNTWPTMNGQWLPSELGAGLPWFENIALIQFIHRTLAMVVVVGFLLWWYLAKNYVKNKHLGKVCCGVAAVIAIQFTLGVATLLHQAPLDLALTHQMTALLLFAMALILMHSLRHEYRLRTPV